MKISKVLCSLLLLLMTITVSAINYPTYQPAPGAGRVAGGYQPAQMEQAYPVGTTHAVGTLTPIGYDNPYAAGGPRKVVPDGWDCRQKGHYDENGDGVCDECEESCEKYVNAGTPGSSSGGQLGTPVGAPVWPLLLLAMGYGALLLYRRRKAA